MSTWLVPAVAFAAIVALQLALRLWFSRRWLANGMSPVRAAALSVAISYVGVLLLVVVGIALPAGASSIDYVPLLIAALIVPVAMNFGMAIAAFRYMDRHGVRESWRRTVEDASAGQTGKRRDVRSDLEDR